MKITLHTICLTLLYVLPCIPANADELRLAVASNFSPTVQHLIRDFEAQYPGTHIKLISGSSGKLYAQIRHGAPYDVFLSADQEKPRRLVEEGLAQAGSRFTYATGLLVLWSRDATRIDSGEMILQTSDFNKLAIANARLAPYGEAAEQVLLRLGLRESSRSKWVQAENIAQTFQFVETGNAEIGFVSKSQVWRNGKLSHGSVWFIPENWYAPIKQDAVLLNKAADNKLAELFLAYLKRADVRARIAAFGYLDHPEPSTTISGDVTNAVIRK